MRKRKVKSNIPDYYEIKYLIDGKAVGQDGKKLVAIPDKFEGKHVRVMFEGKQMDISAEQKPMTHRIFDDKYGRGFQYRLMYYEWNPMTEDEMAEEEAKKFLM